MQNGVSVWCMRQGCWAQSTQPDCVLLLRPHVGVGGLWFSSAILAMKSDSHFKICPQKILSSFHKAAQCYFAGINGLHFHSLAFIRVEISEFIFSKCPYSENLEHRIVIHLAGRSPSTAGGEAWSGRWVEISFNSAI